MFTRFGFLKRRIYTLKGILVLVALLLVTEVHGGPITENEVEDLNILISEFVGGQPNILTILDLSSSMGVNFGGTEVGNWDGSSTTPSSTVVDCERVFCVDSNGNVNCDTFVERILASHCAENAANTSVCGSQNCRNGICEEVNEFNNQLDCVCRKLLDIDSAVDLDIDLCVLNPLINPILTGICGVLNLLDPPSSCNTQRERAVVSALLEEVSGLTLDPPLSLGLGQCFQALNCSLSSGVLNIGCYSATNYDNFKECMGDPDFPNPQTITKNKDSACADGGTPDCRGTPQFGSSRVDVALDVFFDLLDAGLYGNALQGRERPGKRDRKRL